MTSVLDLYRRRAEAQRTLAEIDAELVVALEGERRPTASVEPIFMKVTDYALRSGVSRSTVQIWLKQGLPHVPSANGARIDVARADQWQREGKAREGHRKAANDR